MYIFVGMNHYALPAKIFGCYLAKFELFLGFPVNCTFWTADPAAASLLCLRLLCFFV